MSAKSKPSVNRLFSFHEQLPKWIYGILSIPIIVGLAMWLFWKDIPLIAPLWCILLPLIGLTDREREVAGENGVIINRWRLYDLLLLWKKSEPITNYVELTCRRASNGRIGHSLTSEQE